MNKSAIKNYAVEARKKWIQAIARQAAFYGCTEEGSLSEAEITKQLADKGVFLNPRDKDARKSLVNDISEKGYQNTIEEIAYTWFNRLIAIRYMEVNGYLPSGIRILSSTDAGRIEPECVREYARLDFLNQDTAVNLAAEGDEKLYRYILVEQCNALGKIMPKMFTHIGGIATLLLPERLYIKDALVYDLTHAINEEDFGEQVEIIGWLYQYYISEKHDAVVNVLKKVIVQQEDVPAATQLFTPDWIVRYMVENSLGRLWLERHPNNNLRGRWKYYLGEAEQTSEVHAQFDTLVAQNPINNPEDIKFIDPCMGSGHILVYAFDVLYQIYLSQGYVERDIPDLILAHNIYGLDIDERACQLAYFALMMKARSYNRRFFRREDVPQPQVYAPEVDEELLHYGSLLSVDELLPKPEEPEELIMFEDNYENKLNDWNFKRLLAQKYSVVVTNPPYLNRYNAVLKDYIQKNYSDFAVDLYAVFIKRTLQICADGGYTALMTPNSWMFLISSEKLRKDVLVNHHISTFVHIARGSFFKEATVDICTFVLQNTDKRGSGRFVSLETYKNNMAAQQEGLQQEVLQPKNCYDVPIVKLLTLPANILAYWASDHIFDAFQQKNLYEHTISDGQNITGNNGRFLRYFWEVVNLTVGENRKWVLCAKGGTYRKWYGNIIDIIDWSPETRLFYRKDHVARIVPEYLWYKPCITWSNITSYKASFRVVKEGMLFEKKGASVFPKEKKEHLMIIAFLNSVVAEHLLSMITQAISFQVRDIRSLPFIKVQDEKLTDVEQCTTTCISLSKADWDDFETSWDFQTHPLIAARGNWEEAQPLLYADDFVEGAVVTEWSKTSAPIAQAFDAWERETDRRFNTLKANEEELNRIFIDIYGLQDELTPEAEDKDVTVRRADLGREIRSFISYTVGCMFGRYSLDTPGLAFAGGEWDACKYTSYIPEDDNILPITDADYFDDDIVMRFVDFVKKVYGEDTLAENLDFIAQALYPSGSGTAREMIRKYFQSDFFKDHCKIYQKRPIYWLFDSGKKNGFKALIYLHRYDKYTVARVRTEYLHPLQRKYEAEIERMNKLADLPEASARDKGAFKKQTEKINKQIAECRAYDQIIAHMAAQSIELDPDDGVKVNYEKFQGVEVPREDGNGSVKMNLLGKI